MNIPWGRWSNVFADQNTWKKNGSIWINYESEKRMEKWQYRWIPYNILAQGLWGTSESEAQILADMCEKLYGPAARTMRQYYTLLDGGLRRSKLEGRTWRLPDPRKLYDDAARQRAQQLLKLALEQTDEGSDDHARVADAIDAWNDGWSSLIDADVDQSLDGNYNPVLNQ